MTTGLFHDPVIDEHGPTLHLTWRQYARLIGLLDRSAEVEAHDGYSIGDLVEMTELLTAQARRHPRNDCPFRKG
jgi:hypothetical protein